jgi:hypothetical protein
MLLLNFDLLALLLSFQFFNFLFVQDLALALPFRLELLVVFLNLVVELAPSLLFVVFVLPKIRFPLLDSVVDILKGFNLLLFLDI